MTNDKKPKRGNRGFIAFTSIIACLFMLLLITSCQPVNAQTIIKSKVTNHASLK